MTEKQRTKKIIQQRIHRAKKLAESKGLELTEQEVERITTKPIPPYKQKVKNGEKRTNYLRDLSSEEQEVEIKRRKVQKAKRSKKYREKNKSAISMRRIQKRKREQEESKKKEQQEKNYKWFYSYLQNNPHKINRKDVECVPYYEGEELLLQIEELLAAPFE